MPAQYALVSGFVFGVVSLLQFVRAIKQWPVEIGNFMVPVWASWLAGLVAAVLCIWASQAFSNKASPKT